MGKGCGPKASLQEGYREGVGVEWSKRRKGRNVGIYVQIHTAPKP
jgi:hypothetical protein